MCRRMKAILIDLVEGSATRFGQQPAGEERKRVEEESFSKVSPGLVWSEVLPRT